MLPVKEIDNEITNETISEYDLIPYDNKENSLPSVYSSSEEPKTKSEKEIDEDYILSRKTYKKLIKKGSIALDNMVLLADESGHPRAYEVLAALLKNIADTTDKLMILQETKNKILPGTKHTNNGPGIVNNNLFVGSTTELQEMIKRNNKRDSSSKH